ncbi:MAG TPA: glycosyltransferase family 4 protein, partial [Candidatus Binatia bacterium]|nr:glycosyltransferase family 4 protein [Candidatus Binatia bacterium]
QGAEVTFVLPKMPKEIKVPGVNILSADRRNSKLKFKVIPLNETISAYNSAAYGTPGWQRRGHQANALYGGNLAAEVHRYAEMAKLIAKEVPHDVIHCHDWMTYQAGINAKAVSGKPLVVHVHATEFDRTGGNGVNPHVFHLEKQGFEKADMVMTVSQFTKDKVLQHYQVPAAKVEVTHNAIEFTEPPKNVSKLSKTDKVVLFLGRITLQKGPDWFLYTARKVVDKDPNVKFIVAGNGDMETFMIEKAAELGLAKNVLFTGFLSGQDIDRAYKMADVYVMPSVSEPFGLTPLEAMRNGTPVIISKQSGVSEVIRHCLKVDFWDTHQMANKILGILYYKDLQEELGVQGMREVHKLSWDKTAEKVLGLYGTLLKKRR